MTRNLARTRAVLESAVAGRLFPGAVLEVGSSANIDAIIAVGHFTYDADAAPVTDATVYDLASLTKVLSTTMLAARLVQNKRLRLDDPVRMWCEAWTGDDRGAVTVRHLLLHASGLPAHRRYYERLRGGAAIEAAISTALIDVNRDVMRAVFIVITSSLSKSSRPACSRAASES